MAAANFAMECELLLNRAGALYLCTMYGTPVCGKEGTGITSLNIGGVPVPLYDVYSMNKTRSRQNLSVNN